MPYEVAGNAAVGMAQNMGGGGGMGESLMPGGRGGGGSSVKSAVDCITIGMFGSVLLGLILVIVGVSDLAAATHDSRGDKLHAWDDIVHTWETTGLKAFQGLSPEIHSGPPPPPPPPGPAPPHPPPPPPGSSMQGVAGTLTPTAFGESAWGKDTPASVHTYSWTGKAKCPVPTAANPSAPCTISVQSAAGKTIFGPKTYTATFSRQQATLCQWYDSDYEHPMASLGMGNCPAHGSTGILQSAPLDCVEDKFLDSNGCPADTITEYTYQHMPPTGYGWVAPLVQYAKTKPRFTYEKGKCWDYTDCYCTGCGHTFKTDADQAFTGFGYYYNGHFTPFTTPFHSMTADQRAVQCSTLFDSIPGYTCDAHHVNLVSEPPQLSAQSAATRTTFDRDAHCHTEITSAACYAVSF